MPFALDDVDKRLIESLQEDGRLHHTQLAHVVGLSEAAVRQRVRRLVETGVTQIVAVTDPMTLGFRRMAMIGVRVEAVCEDDDDLLTLLNDKIRAVEGVTSTDTFTYLKICKEASTWGTR